MPKFKFTPVEHDPFAAAKEYASELGGAPRGPETMADIGAAFGRDVNRLTGSIGGAFDKVGRALMGEPPTLEIQPDGSLSPIDPELVDAAGVLAGLTAEGGMLAPKPANALGVFGGIRAKTANLEKLDMARRMEGTYSPDLIWSHTGWFRGGDGQWKFEIPDRNATFDTTVLKPQDNQNAELALNDELDHQASKLGYFGWSDLVSHGNEQEISDVRKQAHLNSGYSAPLSRLLNHPELFKAYPDLAERPVFSAPTGQGYSGLYNDLGDFFEVSPEHVSEQLPIALHEIQHAIQGREGFGFGGSPKDPSMHSVGINTATGMSNKLQDLKAKPVKSDEDMSEIMYLTRILGQIMERPFGDLGYHTLAGEVESRNVEYRHGWDIYGRHPMATEDVPREYQNVRVLRGMMK